MGFLAILLRGISFVPAVVHGIEALFGSKKGADKKESALAFISAALSMAEAVTNQDIVDEGKFRDGLGKVIDGVVQCMNASAWAKKV
ncbi:MAG: hypothetical protein ACRD24_07860 [Terriglobales bacterium]